MTEAVLTDDADGVLVITINRPEARNAVNGEVARGIAAAPGRSGRPRRPERRRADRRGRHVLLGHGPAGPAGRGTPVDRGARFRGHRRTAARQADHRRGRGSGGGGRVRGRAWPARNVVVAAENARFGLPEVKRGLVAAGGGLLRLPRRVPYHLAMEWALTGEYISAERAGATVGLVNRLVAPGTAAAEAAGGWPWPSRATARSPWRATKRIIVESADWPRAEEFGTPARDQRAGARLAGRAGGRARVPGEAPAPLERAITPLRSRWPRLTAT